LNAALANELGKLIADFTGRGATKSRAFVHQDLVVCVFEDGATGPSETSLRPGSPTWSESSGTPCNVRWGRSSSPPSSV
jgi:hypothetical protein